jgi:hypothetical protein
VAKGVRIEDIAREQPVIVQLAIQINHAGAEHGMFSKQVSAIYLQLRQLLPTISYDELQEVHRFIGCLEDNWPPEVKDLRRYELDAIRQISNIGG